MSTSSTELDVDQLMSAIREAAAEKYPDLDTRSKPETTPQAFVLSLKQKNIREPLTLSPEFRFHGDDRYHVNDLLRFHDRDFVKNAYRAILRREPDEDGFLHKLELLRSGAVNKIDILASLRYSDEGERNGITITGLKFPSTVRKLERLPIVGYLLQFVLALVRLPKFIHSQRQFQAYLVAQQFAISDYINDSQRAELDDRAVLLNQVHSIEAAVNETVLPRIMTDTADAQLVALDDRLKNLSEIVSRTRQQISTVASNVRTVERNLAAGGNQTPDELREWDKLYAAFEDQFRGSPEEVEDRLKYYLPFLNELNPDSKILDLGSGRGDWLRLLNKEGFKPHGVEVNAVFAESTRREGFDVSHSDMMVYLGGQADDSLDLVTVFHLIEHINPDKLISLLNEIKRTLKPGGRVFIETPSSENIVVAACNFYADPTHLKPVNPHTLMFILKNMGFIDLGLQFLHSIDDSPFKGQTEGFEQLHMWFYGPRDYSVTARKAR